MLKELLLYIEVMIKWNVKYFTTVVVLLLFPVLLCAQEDIKVESFELSTTTNYANTEGLIEYDDNGEKCALIIVDTKSPELLTFDGGSLGIKKVVPKTGQVWVYVPNGLKRLTISGENMGTLRDYDLGMSVRGARTYILKLTTKDVETIVFNDSIQTQMRVMVISERDNKPISDASISINGMKETLNKAGVLEKNLSGATYRYLVESEFYKTASGTFVVDGTSTEFVIKMQANYEMATIKAPSDCQIWIDGQLKGENNWTGRLLFGDHTITCKQDKHYDYDYPLTITEGNPVEIMLEQPKEIQGTLNISSMPQGADVIVDGRKVGVTPYMGGVIIGSHSIEIRKIGYASTIENVLVQENQNHNMDVTLKQTHLVRISTMPNRAKVTLDNKYLGTSPIEVEMRSGQHHFVIESQGYYTLDKKVQIGDNQKSIKFALKRQNYKSSEIYFGGGYRVMPIGGVQGFVGGYLYNVNMELGYLMELGGSLPIYWNASNPDIRPATATYRSSSYSLRLGYGFALNNLVRITPQLGFAHIVLKESVDTDFAYAHGAYSSNCSIGAKIDLAITPWLVLTISPDYAVAINKSEGYKLLEDISDHIKGLSQGLGVLASFNIRF